jgi:hypothetical protein
VVSSAQETLRATVGADRVRIASGDRPTYTVLWTSSIDGSVDVRIRELPLIHLFVPDEAGVGDGARLLVAQTLGVDPEAFDLHLEAEG